MTRSSWVSMMGAAWLAACSGSPVDDDDKPVLIDDTGTTTPVETTDTPSPPIDDDPWFDADHVLDVTITLPPSDWDALRLQTRSILGLLRGECLAEPFASPFTWYEASATVDGETLDVVGVRKKGLIGSLSDTKPSLKIDTDRLTDGQLFANGTERVTLNNQRQDPSLVHACMAYHVFAEAGLPAPRCNFASVQVNGTSLGMYAHVEAVKKDLLRRHFSTPDGDLYEGALSDFLDGWTGTFEAKTDDTDPTLTPIVDLTAALELPDDEFLAAVDTIIDRDAFLTFWALEALVGHWDGYASNTNNFYVYRDPSTDLLTFLPWGADAVFEDVETPAVFTNGRLANRLWSLPEVRADYDARMRELLDTVWDEDTLLSEVDRMEALVIDGALDPAAVAAGTQVVRDFVSGRRRSVLDKLDATGPIVDLVRDTPCVVEAGSVAATFDTTWGSLGVLDPFAANLPGTLTGDPFPPLLPGGSVVGYDAGVPLLAVLAVTPDFRELYEVLAVVYDWDLQTDVSYPLDLQAGVAYVIRVDLTDPYDEGEVLGILDGSVTFSAVDDIDGSPVAGSLQGAYLEGFF